MAKFFYVNINDYVEVWVSYDKSMPLDTKFLAINPNHVISVNVYDRYISTEDEPSFIVRIDLVNGICYELAYVFWKDAKKTFEELTGCYPYNLQCTHKEN